MLHPIYRPLSCHPATPAGHIESIETCCEISAEGSLWLRYHVETTGGMLKTAAEQVPLRADDLWRTTCFEAFLITGDEPDYAEFNFSPATSWAAYQFASYRAGRTDLALVNAPEINVDCSDSHFALEATVQLPQQFVRGQVSIGLSVVAEEMDGTKSYWAFDHRKAEPDFHDREGFILQLEATPAC
jgi:hypothetical protein